MEHQLSRTTTMKQALLQTLTNSALLLFHVQHWVTMHLNVDEVQFLSLEHSKGQHIFRCMNEAIEVESLILFIEQK